MGNEAEKGQETGNHEGDLQVGTSDLLPCPECKGKDLKMVGPDWLDPYWGIFCDCGYEGPSSHSEKEAEEGWDALPRMAG